MEPKTCAIQQTTSVPPTCVVCRLPIEPKPDALNIIWWPVDNHGPKHWECWTRYGKQQSVECPVCKGVGRIHDK